jgi:hypothetical protein
MEASALSVDAALYRPQNVNSARPYEPRSRFWHPHQEATFCDLLCVVLPDEQKQPHRFERAFSSRQFRCQSRLHIGRFCKSNETRFIPIICKQTVTVASPHHFAQINNL